MIKVFLVEDEVVMRNGIRKNIHWEEEGFQFVGEASDGELAYPLIMKEKPDILITDIKMPFMDGLELSRMVKKEMPQIKIIILSGYNDFDYAKEAIGIGVTDYLLKPIGSAKLLEAIKKIALQIEQEQSQSQMMEMYQKEMQEHVLMQKHNMWNNLVTDQKTMAQLLEDGQKLGIDFIASAYQVILFKLIEKDDTPESRRESIFLTEQINEKSDRWGNQILTFDRSPEGWAFLLKGESEEDIEKYRKQLLHELQILCREYEHVRYFGGIGTVVHRLRMIRDSYKEAGKAFAGRFFTEENCFSEGVTLGTQHGDDAINISDLRSKKADHELLERFLKSGIVEETEDFVKEYLKSLGKQNFQSLIYRQYVLMDLYFICADFLRSIDLSAEELPEEYQDINHMVQKTADKEQLIIHLTGLFASSMNLRDHHSRKRYNDLIEEAKIYINENYQSEDMSLNTAAAKVGMTPSYFSTIFSAEMGQTFVEYLTQVRIEKAKELLMCSGKRTSEIGYEVGYKDSHYFSYIFKKVAGCTPKEFKNRGKEQKK